MQHHVALLIGAHRPKPSTSVISEIKDPSNYCKSYDHIYASKCGFRSHLRTMHDLNIPFKGPRRSIVQYDWNNADNYCAACDRMSKNKSKFCRHLRGVRNLKDPCSSSDM
jgi:hypothetical protein